MIKNILFHILYNIILYIILFHILYNIIYIAINYRYITNEIICNILIKRFLNK